MLQVSVGDRIVHALEGEGTVLRVINPKLLDVLFDENIGVGRFIESSSKHIEALNGAPVNRRLVKWRPVEYATAANRDLTEQQLEFLNEHVVRITYRPHPFNLDKFKSDYESVTGAKCPLFETNRHSSAYSDCAEIYFDSHPPFSLFEFRVKPQGNLWFTENVGLAWILFKAGLPLGARAKNELDTEQGRV